MARRLTLLPLFAILAGCGVMSSAPGLAPASTQVVRAAAADDTDVIPPGYYKGAEGLTGPALLEALHEIIDDHQDLGYDKARDIMFDLIADPTNVDTVIDLYTGEGKTGIRDRRTAYNRGLNTEHTWPQSLGAVGPAQADLHHLRPSDIKINGSRSSYAYGEVKGTEFGSWPSVDGSANRLGNSKAGFMVFEPRTRVRGDIARGLIYFYTCYSVGDGAGAPKPDLRNFKYETQFIVKWNQDDPVDEAEKTRNNAVYKAQGNRNPFIDHPEWVGQAGLPTVLVAPN